MGGEDAGPIARRSWPRRSGSPPASCAYVPVVIEVDGTALLAGKQGPTLPAEIFVYAFDDGGASRTT